MRRALVAILALCGGSGCAPAWPGAPRAPVTPAPVVAVVTVAPSLSRPPRGAPPVVAAATALGQDRWRARLEPAALALGLGTELGSPVAPGDVEVAAADGQWTLRVRGDSPQAALARCALVVRRVSRPLEAERVAALGWLEAERARTLESLRAVEGSLRVLPSEAPRELPRTWDEALTAARTRALEARSDARAADPTSPQVQALERMVADATAHDGELAADFGERHPERVAARTVVESLRALRDRQFALEVRVAEQERASLEERARDRGHNVRRVLWELLRDRLRSGDLGPESVASSDPLSLRQIALERAAESAAMAGQATRYGSRHPRQILAAERVRLLDVAFERQRQFLLASVESYLFVLAELDRQVAGRSGRLVAAAAAAGPRAADPSVDERTDARDQQRLALASALERIAWWQDAVRAPGAVEVLSPCTVER